MIFDKSLLTNLLALLIVAAGLTIGGPVGVYVLNTGLFAVSGGLTNWLAIHMLFERVPGFYGSGVIPLRFEEFKQGIRNLIMEQFFNRANLDGFFQDATEISERLETEIRASAGKLDMDAVFESLVEAVMKSSLGGMLGMVGGRNALNGLREPFRERLRKYIDSLFEQPAFQRQLQEAVRNALESDIVLAKLEAMIDRRLDQMTPELVKQIIQDMIRKHLGWLVVWGAVVGGLLGLVFTLITATQAQA